MAKKTAVLAAALWLALAFVQGCAPRPNEVYELYSNGEYECTLEAENCFRLADLATVEAAIDADERMIVLLIGAPWCPYCAHDIGIIDEEFAASGLEESLSFIYYIDAADSHDSAEIITELNARYDWYVRTLMPCLLAIRGREVAADRRDEAFLAYEDRAEQIRAFFAAVKQLAEQPA